MKKILTLMLAALTMASVFTGCISAPETPPEPTPTPRIYSPNPFTGYQVDPSYYGKRATAIMVNNISACRPQRGLTDAVMLFESKVEGGITRFMAVYEDYENIPTVGPVRSGRDQFLRWAMPMQALYAHIGRSEITQTYIDTFDYNQYDLDGAGRSSYIFRISRPGKDYEHTAYTDAEHLTATIEKYEYDMNHVYSKPVFTFVDYDINGGKRELNGEAVDTINIVHSETYRTYFDYDETTGKFMMSQYNGSKRVKEDTIDENTNTQLGFDNVFVAFADISKYPYPGGNPKGDPNYQYVDMEYGGFAWYFSNGKVERARWFKGGAPDELRFTDMDENPLEVNCGTSYIGFVDLDEFNRFSWAAPEVEIVEEQIDNSQEATSDADS